MNGQAEPAAVPVADTVDLALPDRADTSTSVEAVMCCAAIDQVLIEQLLARYGIAAGTVGAGQTIPGSYWGDSEAGLIGKRIFFRSDTPVHSLLHELSHYVCMTPKRRQSLDTDAGGTDAEECAVCYLEVLLADRLPPFSSSRCLQDMNAWGYSFRQGSAEDWLAGDGIEALDWLRRHELVDRQGRPTWRLRR